jgi:pimeloyl-ACP methyl ester carboxylesterase
MLGLTVTVSPADAQPPLDDPNDDKPAQMCGNGDMFRVTLPGQTLGIDDSHGLWRNIDVPAAGPEDWVDLPDDCDVYAFLVSGYNQNADRDEIIFYNLAELVAQRNGYVHVSHWNNLLKEYMGRPLHNRVIGIRRFGGSSISDVEIENGPGNGFSGFLSFVPTLLDLPKANPDDDFQFVKDLAAVIKAIRARPSTANSRIIVAGHSMGANSITHVALESGVSIDLLALIDPVNNRDSPQGLAVGKTFNWTRWRAAYDFKGYKQYDCRKNIFGGCALFNITPFRRSALCYLDPEFLTSPTKTVSLLARVLCPAPLQVDPGTLITFSEAKVKRLYHGWQTEFSFPFDFEQSYPFGMWTAPSNSILGRNYQRAIPEYFFGDDLNGTCKAGPDPRDPENHHCSGIDGHTEIIGHRNGLRPGLLLNDWVPDEREPWRQLAEQGSAWSHRPANPDLCIVCDDLVDIVRNMIETPGTAGDTLPGSDHTAPTVTATSEPGTPDSGWHAEPPVISFEATDNIGGSLGVASITTALSGAQSGGATTSGATAQEVISAEGTTIVSYFAQDNSGNSGDPETIEIRLDSTGPEVETSTNLEPNPNGWFNADIVVTFSADDAHSGVVSLSDPVTVVTETLEEEVVGFAIDAAGNVGNATVIVKLDKTPPVIALDSRAPAANAAGWNKSPVTVNWNCTDAVSGVLTPSDTATVGGEGAAQSVLGTCRDHAGHAATDTVAGINLDLTPPAIALDSRGPSANAAGWNTSPLTVTWICTDALSGVQAASNAVTVNTEGAAQSAIGTCRDRADHVTTDTVADINVDMTAPVIALDSRAPAANAAGWNNSQVTVSWNCTDAVSGVLAASDTATAGGEGAAQSVIGTCRDNAGHAATDTVAGINVDLTPPVITLQSYAPEPNAAGWNNTDVTVTWHCGDALSGPVAGQASAAVSSEGAAQNVSGQCVDRADNAAGDTRSVNVDKTSPTGQITTPANGAVYLLNAIANAAYGCADGLSGVTACAGTVGAGAAVDTATVGDKTFSVSVADAAGNQSAASHSYTVQYAFSGFSNPIAAMPAVNTANAGKTVPVKYSLRDINNAVISDLTSFVSLISAPVACDTNVPTAAAEETDAAGSTTIHFDSGQFIYNWKTQAAWQGTCRVLQLELKDGTRHMVTFQFK